MRQLAGVLRAAILALAALGVGGCTAGIGAVTATPAPTVAVSTPTQPLAAPTQTATATLTAAEAHPVYPIYDADGGFLLGGTQDGQWLDAKATAAAVSGPVRYRIYTGSKLSTQTTGTIETPADDTGPCAFPQVKTGLSQMEGAIGLAGGWDPAPREVKSLMPDITIYQDAIATILKQNAIANPEVFITGTYLVDLDGDDTDEVVMSAWRLANSHSDGSITPGVAAGDYTLLALRKVVGQSAQTFAFGVTAYPKADEQAYPWRPTILALLDLNGDGRLELIVRRDAFEGRQYDVYEIDGTSPKVVLTGGCSI